jgi:hypothetical protein
LAAKVDAALAATPDYGKFYFMHVMILGQPRSGKTSLTKALLGHSDRHEGGAPEADITGVWHSLNYEFRMEAGEARLPRPPIK